MYEAHFAKMTVTYRSRQRSTGAEHRYIEYTVEHRAITVFGIDTFTGRRWKMSEIHKTGFPLV